MVSPILMAALARVVRPVAGAMTTYATTRALGPVEERALHAVTRRAAEQLVESWPDALDQSAYMTAWLERPDVASVLVEAAMAEAEPDHRTLAGRLKELGHDETTSPLDLVAEAVRLTELIRAEMRRRAEAGDATLFNKLVLAKLDRIDEQVGGIDHRAQPGIPPPPDIFVGREADVAELRQRLCANPLPEKRDGMRVTVVRGWPGVGKSSLAAAVAHDSVVRSRFSDGVLWASLSDVGDVPGELNAWCRQLGLAQGGPGPSDVAVQSRRLAERLRDSRTLLVIDDAWRVADAAMFLIGGRHCAALLTTRMTEIAHELDPNAYALPVLAPEASLDLMRQLAPAVVKGHEREIAELIAELEGLPLALRVAARLLATEHHLGWGVEDLLRELRVGAAILEAQAPADRVDLASATTPTVAALLAKSTDRLPPATRIRFAELGVFAHRPATFDLAAVAQVWAVSDPKPDVRLLVSRGLLEPIGGSRFQMHALLAMHARSLLFEGDGR